MAWDNVIVGACTHQGRSDNQLVNLTFQDSPDRGAVAREGEGMSSRATAV